MICPNCGKAVNDGTKFCIHCGARLQPPAGGGSQNPQYGGGSQNQQYGGGNQNQQYGGGNQNQQYGGGIQPPSDSGTQPDFPGTAPGPKIPQKYLIPIIVLAAAAMIGGGLFFGLRKNSVGKTASAQQPASAVTGGQTSSNQTSAPQTAANSDPDYYLSCIDRALPYADPQDVFPNRELTDADLAGLDAKQIQHLVNTIFAKNYYSFHTPEALNFYRMLPWYSDLYTDQAAVNNGMNELDSQNLKLLLSYRSNLNYDPNNTTGIDALWTYWYTSQELTPNLIAGMSSYDLSLLANTIYAKYGYIFSDSNLSEIFAAQEWYYGITPDYRNISFNSLDIANLELIGSYY